MSDAKEWPRPQLRTRLLESLEADLRMAAKGSAWANDLKLLQTILRSTECSYQMTLLIAKGRGLL